MRPMRINSGKGLVGAILMEMDREGISRYHLANLLALELKSNPINIDKRLARMFSGKQTRVDVDFAIKVARQFDLVLEIKNK